MSQPAICTIISNNYLAFARVLAGSFREHHPGGRVWVLVVDRPKPGLEYPDDELEVLFAADLGIPAFANFAFRYSVLELNTAVKPYLIEHLHRRHGVERLCYLDPDILVTAPLDPLFERLETRDVLLTPHVTEPITDSATPGERDFLLSGMYNLGFLGIAINERTLPFLAWWQARLQRFCVHQVSQGLFVDQKWMDFAPSFLDRAEILRDPGFNMAYWNLPHRTLESTPEGYRVDGEPLRFFHFSGFELDRPERISKYQNRYRLSDRPDLAGIFAEYRQRLITAGHEATRELEYAYGSFDNGVQVPPAAREALKVIDWKGERWPDPFDTGCRDSFFGWLQEPVRLARGGRLPRLALVLWDHRQDLQKAFPQPVERDAAAFVHWFTEEVRRQQALDPFAAYARLPRQARERPAKPRPGVEGDRFEPASDQLSVLVGRTPGRPPALGRRESAWLTEEASMQPGCRPRIPRLAMLLRRDRHDVTAAFPDPLGADRVRFALWYVTSARSEFRLASPLVRPVLRSLPLRVRLYASAWWLRARVRRRRGGASPPVPLAVAAESRPGPPAGPARPAVEGLNVVGWSEARTGIGEICRATLEALDLAGVPRAIWPLRHPVGEADGASGHGAPASLPYATTLFHVNADMMEWVQHQLPLSARSGQFRIGYWFWELAYFPRELAPAFRHVDEVWAPSRFCQQAFSTLSPVPVRWVPPAVRPMEVARLKRTDLGLPRDAFVFLFVFDALSVPERKNPLALMAAFRRAVEASDVPLHLVIKVGNSAGREVEELERRAAGLPVTLLERSLTRQQLAALIAEANAYVSLHRSEGLGLPLIEAMLLGTPVIAPAYGGCTDYLDDSTAWPVPFDLVHLRQAHGPYPAGAVWADADPEAAAALMLEVVQSPEEAAARSLAARRRVEGLYSPRAAAERFHRELSRLSGGRPPPPRDEAAVEPIRHPAAAPRRGPPP